VLEEVLEGELEVVCCRDAGRDWGAMSSRVLSGKNNDQRVLKLMHAWLGSMLLLSSFHPRCTELEQVLRSCAYWG
jgi:hypothetical protein